MHTQTQNPKLLLITGGGRGIGRATVRLAAREGYTVCFSYHSQHPAAASLVAELQAQGHAVHLVQADVSREDDVEKLFEALDAIGPLHGLVNNAGILEQQMRLDEMDVGRWQRVLGTNVIGTFLCSRLAVRRMSSRYGGAGGAIVNVSSAASRLGSPGEYVDYAASKGAVDTLTLGLAREVAAEGIRVNGVRPGIIDTDIHASGGEPGRIDRVKHAIPMQRGGLPEEVAHAIMWLLSDGASYVTGSILDVAGGR